MAVNNFIVTFASSNEDKVFFKRTKIMKYSELYRKLKKAGGAFYFVMEADTTSGPTLPMGRAQSFLGMELERCRKALSNLSIKNLGFSPGSSSMRILVCEKNTFGYELIII